jgi:hypothetical protein
MAVSVTATRLYLDRRAIGIHYASRASAALTATRVIDRGGAGPGVLAGVFRPLGICFLVRRKAEGRTMLVRHDTLLRRRPDSVKLRTTSNCAIDIT